jgi:Rrf2 family protein
MKISQKTQYGLRAIVYLARFSSKKKLCCLKKISQDEGIPFSFLEKIIAELVKNGLVFSQKGAKGGYYLAKKADKIKVGKVIEILEGVTAPVSCLEKKINFLCPREKLCLAKKFWKKFQKSINSALNSLTLGELIK